MNGPSMCARKIGNVNTGACDPLGEICEAAHSQDAWVHVDGAFGHWAAASPKYSHLLDGIACADSWATDAHKWLNVPQDSGIVIVKEPQALRHAMGITLELGRWCSPHRQFLARVRISQKKHTKRTMPCWFIFPTKK
jgi:glutamate/tyrosine decarboxylase-like PLP-dependent enzyme